ncbi:MAG TPA: MFS transporter, partial [Candidatus Limnocylindrales bacterium]
VGAARMLPYILLSIPAGIISDRFDRRLVLLTTDLARAACMLVMAWIVATGGPLWAVAAVAILAACFSTFFYPAIGALIPSLVRDEREFGPANSAWATLDNMAWIVGPGIAGVLLATGELVLAFVLNAVSFTLIAVILWSLPRSSPGAASSAGPAPSEDSTAALDDATETPEPEGRVFLGRRVPASINLSALAGVVLIDAFTWFTFGGISILIVVIAVDVFHGGDAATGYLNAAIGIGGTIGALLSGALVLRPRLGGVLLVGAAAFAVATVILGLANQLAVAFLAIAVISAGNLILDVTRTTIFQRVVPDEYRGRFGGLMMTSQTLSEAGGTLIVPILVSLFGFGIVMGFAGVGVAAATILAVALIAGAGDVPIGEHDLALRRIARLSLFGGLPPARVEGALRRLEPLAVHAGDVIVREGDPADRFYVIDTGSFDVTQADTAGGEPRHLRTLGTDEVFGERGLIGQTPRTATVTAATDGLLFEMDGDDFLHLVGARKGVADRLMALYDPPTAEVVARG